MRGRLQLRFCGRGLTIGAGLAISVLLLASCRRAPIPFPNQAVVEAIARHTRLAHDRGLDARIAAEPLAAGPLLTRFYSARRHSPAWSRDGALLPAFHSLLKAIEGISDDALNPDDYHRGTLVRLAAHASAPAAPDQQPARAAVLAEIDVVATDAFMLLAAHATRGKVRKDVWTPRWDIADEHPDLPALLEAALQRPSVAAVVSDLLPQHRYYQGLKRARASLQKQATTLRAEARRGRRPVLARLRTVELNMERWRWMAHHLGDPHLLVNVAAFEIEALQKGRTQLVHRAVVGSEAWPTFDFSSAINEVVVNPFWNAPRHVLVTELINYMRQDPNYLAANKMTLLRRAGDGEQVLDPRQIDFRDLAPEDIDFRLRQDPGPLNVLGRLMFRLPNEYAIYLHDTPYQEDFGKDLRMFSHGCVRIQEALDVAAWLLRGEPGWNKERLRSAIDGLTTRVVPLARPIPTHVLYATAWPTAGGGVRFLPDVYHRDAKLDAALRQPFPRTAGPSSSGARRGGSRANRSPAPARH